MRNIISIAIILFFLPGLFSAQVKQAEAKKGTLIVKVTGLRTNHGYVVCHLFNDPDAYPLKSKKALVFQDDLDISDSTASFVFKDLPYGDYAFTTHHDENANHKMDKSWLGLPAEGWACSNNVMGILGVGPPSFEDAHFTINKDTIYETVKMNY